LSTFELTEFGLFRYIADPDPTYFISPVGLSRRIGCHKIRRTGYWHRGVDVRKKRLIYILIVLVIAAAGYWLLKSKSSKAATGYEFSTVTTGNIENTVSSTGTLAPVTSVEVGTQVSGTIDSVYVDYNDEVREGQILAVLDTTLLKAAVLDAEATIQRTEAALEQAQAEYDRNKVLFERDLISEMDYLPYQVSLKTQKANLTSSQAALDRAKRNLSYAVIRSPIHGTVIERNVDAGQTVAASLSTPTLFIIAQDLSRMEILADVDESDIGEIKDGQRATFQVLAYSDENFSGTVKQIRLQPKTVSNVVTYTVVIESRNDEGLLLPGMTAMVDFITEKRDSVLMVPNKALKFQPSQEVIQKFRAEREKAMQNRGGPLGGAPPDSAAVAARFANRSGNATGAQGNFGMVWFVDSTGQVMGAPLRTGLSDGTNTEVLGSRALHEGMQIIVGTATAESAQKRNEEGPPRGFRMRGF